MNQFIISAIAEKIAVYYADDMYAERSERGKEKQLSEVLKQVRQRPADEHDVLGWRFVFRGFAYYIALFGPHLISYSTRFSKQ